MKIKTIDFNLKQTLDSGQFFGYRSVSSRHFEMDVLGVHLKIRQTGEVIYLRGAEGDEFREKLCDFFDLRRDLTELYSLLAQDPKLRSLLRLKGLRILKQDPWEVTGTFIISSNNNIKRISHLCQQLSSMIGKKNGSFPSVEEIANSSPNFLRKLGLGYRAEYLHETAGRIAADPSFLGKIAKLPYAEAREAFMQFPGVGPKIADCILLFGYQFFEAFPVDVWIERIMHQLYFPDTTKTSEDLISEARSRWGGWAGYVQQYLYQGSRKGLLKNQG